MRGRLSTAGAAVAGMLLAVLVGCADPPVSPLPIQTPAGSEAAAPDAPPVAPTAASPAPVVTTVVGRPQPAPAPAPRQATTTRPRSPRSLTPAPTEPSPTPTPTPTPTSETPSEPPDCLGNGPYDVDAAATEEPTPSLCVESGATLRVSNVGPDEVTVEPADLVTQVYEAGVANVTFTAAGTVAVTVTWQGGPHVIEVEVRPPPSSSAAE